MNLFKESWQQSLPTIDLMSILSVIAYLYYIGDFHSSLRSNFRGDLVHKTAFLIFQLLNWDSGTCMWNGVRVEVGVNPVWVFFVHKHVTVVVLMC